MKTVFIVLGVILLLCCGSGGAVLFFTYRAGTAVMSEAQSYGDESLNAICKTWDAAELERRAAKELIDQNPPGTLAGVVDKLKVLGPLQSLKSSVTGLEAKTSTEAGTYTLAKYSADCVFEKAPRIAELELIKRGDEWRILTINIRQK